MTQTPTAGPADSAIPPRAPSPSAASVGMPSPPGAVPVAAASGRGSAAMLATVLGGQFMALLDVSVVNVAAPTIRSRLHASGGGLQLVVAGYAVTYAVLLVTGSRLGALLGCRRMFRCGLAVFTAASLACGLAGSVPVLVASRVVQGAGAAMMVPQVLSLIQASFVGRARARALGLYAAVISGGAVAGQILGGLLVGADLFGWSWRPVFLLNVPVGVLLLVLARRLLPAGVLGTGPAGGGRSAGDTQAAGAASSSLAGGRGRALAGRLDLPGLLVLAPGLLLVVLPLVLGHERGWPLWCWVCVGGGVLVLGGFAVVEAVVGRRGGVPLVPGRLLRSAGLVPAAATLLLLMTAYGGYLFCFTLFLQSGLGYGALRAGCVFLPTGLLFAAVSLTWSRLPARWHRLLPVVSLVPVAVGWTLVGVVASAGGGQWALVGASLVAAGPLAGAFSPLMSLGLRRVAVEDVPHASGLMATLMQFGQVLGVAVFGSVYLADAAHPGHAALVAMTALGATTLVSVGFAAVLARQSAGASQPAGIVGDR